VLEGLLRAAAIAASGIVILSFVLFAVDETRAASQRTVDQIAGQRAAGEPDPTPKQERARERAHGRVRELIDDADDVLLAPFASLAPRSSGTWVHRGVPTIAAVVVYGFGLSFLARFAKGRP
jgi:hypothetical protein